MTSRLPRGVDVTQTLSPTYPEFPTFAATLASSRQISINLRLAPYLLWLFPLCTRPFSNILHPHHHHLHDFQLYQAQATSNFDLSATMSALIASIGGLGLLFNNYTVGSLNLFFFWMTWTTLILSHPPLRVQIFTVLFTRILFFFIPALIFTCFDWVLPKLAGKHEFVQSKGAKTFKVPIGRGKTKELRFSNINKDTVFAIMMTLLNFLLGVAVQAGIEYIATDIFKKDRPLKVTSTLPMPWSMGKSIFYAMLLREVCFLKPKNSLSEALCVYANAST